MMQKLSILFLMLFVALGVQAQEMKVKDVSPDGSDLSASTQSRLDKNGNPCALVKVQMPSEGATFDGNIIPPVEFIGGEYWVYMTKGSHLLKIMHPECNPLMLDLRDHGVKGVEPKVTYVIVVQMPVTSVPVTITTQVEGTTATLDDDPRLKSDANGVIFKVPLGKHRLVVSDVGGHSLMTTDIQVDEMHTKFDYDLRKRRAINITSAPSGGKVFIDGKEVGVAEPTLSLELPYASYNVRVQLSEKEFDERAITISDYSRTEETFTPVERKVFNVITVYDGLQVPSTLTVNGKERPEGKTESHAFSEFVGKSLNVYAIADKGSARRIINVEKNMNTEQTLVIKAQQKFKWPWQIEYHARPVGFSLGYVQKQALHKGSGSLSGQEMKQDPAYQVQDEWVRGIQAGVFVNPTFSWGLGLHTGLFYELYGVKDTDYEQDTFTEHSLNIPVHLSFRIPFSHECALQLRGGISADYGLAASYSGGDDERAFNSKADYYGETGMRRFNASLDAVIGLSFKGFGVQAYYSKGLVDHNRNDLVENTKIYLNKLGISLFYALP